MSSELHRQQIIDYVKKRSKWNDTTFHQVHWGAHESAFTSLSRNNQVMVVKLIHNLVNINVQNAKLYGKSSSCPCCLSHDETLAHIFSCPSEGSIEHCAQALVTLKADLTTISTPTAVIEAMIYGMTLWVCHQTESELHVHTPTVGSLHGPDVLLTAALTEQYQSIGWYNFLLGRISVCWGKAVAMYNKSTDPSYPTAWTTQTILLVWKFSCSLWIYRNTIVHGATDQEVAAKIRASLDDKV
jgi:hypothetical protein